MAKEWCIFFITFIWQMPPHLFIHHEDEASGRWYTNRTYSNPKDIHLPTVVLWREGVVDPLIFLPSFEFSCECHQSCRKDEPWLQIAVRKVFVHKSTGNKYRRTRWIEIFIHACMSYTAILTSHSSSAFEWWPTEPPSLCLRPLTLLLALFGSGGRRWSSCLRSGFVEMTSSLLWLDEDCCSGFNKETSILSNEDCSRCRRRRTSNPTMVEHFTFNVTLCIY